ncbi:MAG TPA: VIT domain-containing protein [Gemmatimonadaceae bacterium]|nr:VIT domain-containing protein [Gemmatimonadaceae bacterium]
MRSFLFSLVLGVPAALSAQIIDAPPRPLPCPVPPCVRGRPCVMPACGIPFQDVVRQSSDVRVNLVDRVLRYEVTETFVNRGSRVGEADFMFPLPKGAAFQDLKLSINGEMVAGETMSADRARQIYEEIVRRQRDPALLEWMGYGLLRARIFPIAPGEVKKVVVRFQTVAPREGDALRVDYFRGQRSNQVGGSQRLEGGTSLVLTYPNDPMYGTAYSPTHTIYDERYGSDYSMDNAEDRSFASSNRGSVRRVEVRDARGEVTLLIPIRRSTSAAISMLANAPGNEDGFALITLSPPAVRPRAVPRDLTFVLDVSGSMSGEKIEQARAAGKQLLRTLSPADRFRLIDFSSDVRTFRDDYSSATPENIRAATRYLDELDAEGSTNISGALDEALSARVQSGRLPIILFLTDGQPTIGERNASVIASNVAKQRGSRRLFTFGVGADLNVSLIEQLALEGRGTASFVRPDESVERAVGIVASRLTSPLVTDVRVHADGVRLLKMHPAMPVDIFAGEDLVLLARYDGDGDATLRFDGQTTSGPVTWTARVNFPERSRGNSFVARLWATQRVGYLSAEKRKHGGSQEINDEIRELGERFGIPTEFSSYLVVEPGMNQRRIAGRGVQLNGVVGSNSAPAAAPAPAVQFEAAKAASEQRAATSVMAADAAAGIRDDASVRRAGNVTFVLRDGVWTDVRYKGTGTVLRVKPYSDAYFKLLDIDPDLREAFSIGERAIVAGKKIAIELTPSGEERLTDHDIALLRDRW